MKKTIIASQAFVLALVIGCASFQTNAAKLLTSTALTVDATMKGWATYVVQNNISDVQQAPVKKAYSQYQIAMGGAQAAYTALIANGDKNAWQQASAMLTASSSALTQLVASITGGK